MGLKSQVKGMITLLMSIIIAVAVNFLGDHNPYPTLAIIVAFIVQVTLLFVLSEEEKYFDKKVKHMQDMEDLEHKTNERANEIKSENKLKKMQEKANQVTQSNRPKQETIDDYKRVKDLLDKRWHNL